MPALRERPKDILPLAEIFLAESAARNRPIGLQFSEESREALIAYSWPGNIRELRNAVERAVVLSRGESLLKEDLPEILLQPRASHHGNLFEQSTLEQIEQEHIRSVIALAPTLEDAAATLGIATSTLWRKRKRHQLDDLSVSREQNRSKR
jgi:two-component system, NtrC family, response regulator AlgB